MTHFRMPVKQFTIDFWSMSRNFIYRHHVEPRVKLYSPRGESFPIPLKYIDATRTTHEFGCQAREAHRRLLECRWVSRVVRSLDRFHTIYSIGRKMTDYVVRGEINEKTLRPDHLGPELWEKVGKHAKLKEKQNWSHGKPKLDNAKKLTRNSFH